MLSLTQRSLSLASHSQEPVIFNKVSVAEPLPLYLVTFEVDLSNANIFVLLLNLVIFLFVSGRSSILLNLYKSLLYPKFIFLKSVMDVVALLIERAFHGALPN